MCGKTFLRRRSDLNQSRRRGAKIVCGLKCAGIANIGNIPESRRGPSTGLRKGSERDEYSPFRAHLRVAKRRQVSRDIPCTITLEDLKVQWDRQHGICPYTGLKMIMPPTIGHYDLDPLLPQTASLDRIDSGKGYEPDNIQFVCTAANLAKCNFTHEQMIEFWQQVKSR